MLFIVTFGCPIYVYTDHKKLVCMDIDRAYVHTDQF